MHAKRTNNIGPFCTGLSKKKCGKAWCVGRGGGGGAEEEEEGGSETPSTCMLLSIPKCKSWAMSHDSSRQQLLVMRETFDFEKEA